MSTGTLTLTQNSTEVVGTETTFSKLEEGGVIYVSLGGVNHSLVVSSIASDTRLTLARAYIGATQSGISWIWVPREALIGIHAQLAADNGWSRRASVLDKQNWYRVFSADGTITVTLPDGSTFTGPSWKYLTNALANKVNSSDLGTAAAKNAQTSTSDTTSGALMAFGAFGLGDILTAGPGISTMGAATPTGFYASYGDGYGELGIADNLTTLVINRGNRPTRIHQAYTYRRTWFSYYSGAAWTYHEAYTTGNTTKASDGTLKAASPVVKLFSDGSYETNDESEGVTASRLDVGQYLIEGCEALNADAAWGGWDGGFDIPTDRNKQPLIWLDYEVNPDGSVIVKTYHRTHPESPEFARNLKGYKNDAGDFIETIANGEPVDIPSDQFVSVRVEMPKTSIWNQRQAELAEAELLATGIIPGEE